MYLSKREFFLPSMLDQDKTFSTYYVYLIHLCIFVYIISYNYDITIKLDFYTDKSFVSYLTILRY